MTVLGGIIDSGYRNTVKVIVWNMGKEDVKTEKRERIAQVILELMDLPQVEIQHKLINTERGENDLGSTILKELDWEYINNVNNKRYNF